MEIISIKMDKEMLERIDKLIKENNYGTRTEFIRSSIREKMSRLEKDQILKELLKLKGSSKTHTTDEQLRKTRIEVGEELLREYNLK
jgi:Arc/MetJ-type ribon-helix-helix transcriptional regulator